MTKPPPSRHLHYIANVQFSSLKLLVSHEMFLFQAALQVSPVPISICVPVTTRSRGMWRITQVLLGSSSVIVKTFLVCVDVRL